jgi:hypothetical protein
MISDRSFPSTWPFLLGQPPLVARRYEKIVTLASQVANSASSLSEFDNFSTALQRFAVHMPELSRAQKSLSDPFFVGIAPLSGC